MRRTIVVCTLSVAVLTACFQPDVNQRYFEAVFENDIETVQDLLDRAIDIDQRPQPSTTAMFRPDVVTDFTALMVAIRYGNIELAELLIEAEADVNAQGFGGITALMIAAGTGDTTATTVLLEAGADTTLRDTNGVQALGLASENGQLETVQLLVDAGAPVDEPQRDGVTPFMYAAFEEHFEIAQLLLDAGADIDALATEPETTALMAAASEGRIDAVRFLIANGADVNQQNSDNVAAIAIAAGHNQTPLIVAVAFGTDEIASVLLRNGADPNWRLSDNGRHELPIESVSVVLMDTTLNPQVRGYNRLARGVSIYRLRRYRS